MFSRDSHGHNSITFRMCRYQCSLHQFPHKKKTIFIAEPIKIYATVVPASRKATTLIDPLLAINNLRRSKVSHSPLWEESSRNFIVISGSEICELPSTGRKNRPKPLETSPSDPTPWVLSPVPVVPMLAYLLISYLNIFTVAPRPWPIYNPPSNRA